MIATTRRFFSWPSRPGNHMVPWPIIAWRLVASPLVYSGLVLAFVGLLLGWGLSEAMRFWRNAT